MKKIAFTTLASAAILSGGLMFGSNLMAQTGEMPGQVDVSRVTAGNYELDPVHTLVEWSVNHFGFNDYFGLFGDIEGTMTLDPADIENAEFQIMVPIAQVTVASEELKDHLLRPGKDGAEPDFFGPEPGTATFTSTAVRQIDDTSAVVSGMLEMNGNTGPVTMRVEFTGAGTNPFSNAQTVGFHAYTVIDRTAWDINYGQGLIGNDVELKISAAFEKQ
jgi:polyisoprenoid-binding protein YceI